MTRRPWMLPLNVLAIAALSAASARADDVPAETLLAAESVGYLRFDGLASHREAYDKTIFAQTVRDEFQPLIDAVARLILDAIGPEVLGEKLLAGARPGELIKLQKAVRQLPRVVELLKNRGFAVGIEVIDPQQARFQITFVFTGEKADSSAVLGAFRLLSYAAEQKLTEANIAGRTVLQFTAEEPVHLHCWKEGAHVVLTIGSEDPKRTIALASGKRKNLTSTKLFRRVAGFDSYETLLRGFFNVSETLKALEKAVPPAKAIVQVLGINGLKDLSFHLGFAGKMNRSTVFLGMPGERRGLLKLVAPRTGFSLKGLPPMPPDSVAVSAAGADFALAYAEILKAVKLAAAIVNPAAQREFETALADFEKTIGVGLKKDIIDSLGSTVAVYTSASEGPLNLGTTIAIEVKDAERLKKALETMSRSMVSLTGADISLQKRVYRGATLHMLKVNERGFPFVPTYAIHNGWLVVSFFPQPVQGFVFRTGKAAETWRPPALLDEAVQATLKQRSGGGGAKQPRLVGVAVSDPRPGVKQLLSLSPLLISFIRNFGGELGDFDISLIPNSQAVTERLSESVTVAVDDGDGVRIEGYSTLPFPAQLTGIDVYGYFALFSFARIGF